MTYRITLGTVGLLALMAVAVADPSTNGLFPPCLWRAATGWLCPGCGSARALHALVHGRLGDAFSSNPLTIAAIPVIGINFVNPFGIVQDVMTYRIKPLHIRMFAAAIVGFGVLRNLIP